MDGTSAAEASFSLDGAVPNLLKSGIELGFFLTLPLAAVLLVLLFRNWRPWLVAAALVPTVLAVYAYHVEPRLLTVREHGAEVCGGGLPGTLRAGVVSDTHLGLFGNAVSMERVARRLGRLDLDLVLVPGDLTYHPEPDAIPALMAPLGAVGVPVYAVMGNHDVGLPGPDLATPLTAALEAVGVTVLNPGEAVFTAQGKYLRVAGLRDFYQVETEGAPLGLPEPAPMATILLEHNPDAVFHADMGPSELMVAGHTHGGQVYIPWVTCAVTFACDTLRYGYEDNPAGKLFVTSGTGMVGLPIRFAVPPRIDVLTLAISRCPSDGRDREAA